MLTALLTVGLSWCLGWESSLGFSLGPLTPSPVLTPAGAPIHPKVRVREQDPWVLRPRGNSRAFVTRASCSERQTQNRFERPRHCQGLTLPAAKNYHRSLPWAGKPSGAPAPCGGASGRASGCPTGVRRMEPLRPGWSQALVPRHPQCFFQHTLDISSQVLSDLFWPQESG